MFVSLLLLSVGNRTSFADDSNLNLTWICHFCLNLCCDISAKCLCLSIGHLVSTNDYAKLTTCLNCVCLCYAWVAHSDSLKVVETLDVCLYDFTTSTWTSARDSITNLYDWSKHCVHLHFIVVSTDGVTDVWLLLIFLCELSTIECVWNLTLLIRHLTDIVKQTCTLCLLWIEPKLRCHYSTEIGCFTSMLEKVLAIRRTVFHLTYDTNELWVETVDTEVDSCTLTSLDNLVVKLFLYLCHNLLDTSWVDTSVSNELVKGKTANLTTDWVET